MTWKQGDRFRVLETVRDLTGRLIAKKGETGRVVADQKGPAHPVSVYLNIRNNIFDGAYKTLPATAKLEKLMGSG